MAEKQYTRQAQEALNMARKIAAELKHPYVGTEHLLFGLKRVFTGVAGQVLDKNKVDEEQMEKAMDILVSAPEAAKKERKHLEYSPRLRYILEESQNEAVQLASEKVGTEHLLLTMLKDGDCVATRMLMTLNVNIQKLFQDLLLAAGIDPKEYMENQKDGEIVGGIIDQYSTDLTQEAREGKLDPVIGREKEIARIMEILSRRTKNNPCLVGEPGVAGEQLPVRPFLEYRETKYYGLTVDPANGDVYVADAVDYQQQGVVYRYTAKGEPVDEFHVGVAPGAFCWK